MKARPLSASADASSACLALSLTSRVAGTSGRTARTSSAADVPSLAAIEIVSNRPSRSSSAWAVLTSQTAMLPKPSESTSPNDAVPVIR